MVLLLCMAAPCAAQDAPSVEELLRALQSNEPVERSAAASALGQRPEALPQVRALLKDERGANLVEYIILVGVVALIALAGYKVFGGAVDAKIKEQEGAVRSINGAAH